MELIYIWINKHKNGFVTKQGFNFYGEHQFDLKIHENPKRYVLSYSNLQFVFNYGTRCIKNITALVGENGAGKTTLFNCIYSGGCFPHQHTDGPGYERMDEDNNEENKKILVYRIGDRIEIFHNLEPGTFVNQTTFPLHSINDADQNDRFHLFELLEQQTIIYLSNSNYASNFSGYEIHGKINSISLTPSSLKTITANFYKKMTLYPECIYINNFYILQGLLIKNKTTQDFQQICDVLYFHKLYSNGLGESYIGKECKSLYVNFKSATHLIEMIDEYAYISKDGFASNGDPSIIRLSERIKKFNDWFVAIDKKILREIFSTLYLNMIFEMYYCWDCFSLEQYHITFLDDFSDAIESMIDSYKRQQDYKREQADYYKHGLEEVLILQNIMRNCDTVYNNIQEEVDDLSYRTDKVVSYTNDKETYLSFCAFIDSAARNRQSVLLKYIKIDNLYMSSGERAYLNFFSWLNLPPKFDEYIEGTPIPIRDSLLLLIDEIDLYMHPEWQRQAIQKLIEELSRQYGEKEIQIIVSTHSPLVLSDIPKQNTIYLKPRDGNLDIINKDSRPQTFGANIHTLLSDAFFLNSTMGAYAHAIIKKIGDDLMKLYRDPVDETLKEKCRSYKPLIELIGEPLIRNKLTKVFNECFPELYDDQIKIYRERVNTLTKLLKEEPVDRLKVKELKDTLQYAMTIIDAISEDIE